MQYRQSGGTYLVRLDADEEIVASIAALAADRRIDAGDVAGIGTVRRAVLGFLDPATGTFVRRALEEDLEILSLLGTLAIRRGHPDPAMTVTLARRTGEVTGGRLLESIVATTCEFVVRPFPGYVQRVDGIGPDDTRLDV